MLSREDLRVEVAIFLSRDSPCIRLAAYFDADSAREEDVFWDKRVVERVVERVEVECGILLFASHRRRRRHRASRLSERESR